MATASVSSPHAQLTSNRTLAVGLLWGSGLLFVYSLWLRKNHPELAIGLSLLLWILVLTGAALGVWLHLGTRRQGDPGTLAGPRRLAGIFLLGAGIVLAVVAGYLGYSLRLAGLGESLGLGLFALGMLVSGCIYAQPIRETPSTILESVSRQVATLRNGLLVIGIVCAGAFAYLAFVRRIGADWFPELAMLLFEGLLCVACGMWLAFSRPEERTPMAMRVFLLVLGGLSGLFLGVMTFARALLWRQDVFMGGIAAWQGENGYRFWLCAYLGLIALVVMFSSVLLVRSEVRTNAVLRQVLYGYNAVVTGLMLLAFLIVLNVICYALFPMTFEWTRLGGLMSLAPKSKNLLANLKETTTVYVLLPSNHPAYHDTQAMLNNALAISDKLHVKYISPDQDFLAYEKLSQHFPEILPSGRAARFDQNTGRGLLVVYGPLPEELTKKVPHAFISDRKIFEETGGGMPGQKPTRFFRGEVELMRELDFLEQGQKQRKIYFLQGNDELDINNQDPGRRVDLREPMSRRGAAVLAERLKKDNYNVQGLDFGRPTKEAKKDNIVFPEEKGSEKRKDVPEDAWAVVVLGPSQELSKTTMNALERYLETGGKMIVSLDITLDETGTRMKNSGIEALLKRYGVDASNDFVMRLVPDAETDPRMVFCNLAKNPTTYFEQFSKYRFALHTARVIRPDAKAFKYKASPLFQAQAERRQEVWEDSNLRALRNPIDYMIDLDKQGLLIKKLAEDPLPVAVTVAEEGKDSKDTGKPRMVVFGDTDFLNNLFMRSTAGDIFYSLFVGSLEWMAERPGGAGIPPKETQTYAMSPGVDANRMVILPGWFMGLGIVGLGTGIWLVRRR